MCQQFMNRNLHFTGKIRNYERTHRYTYTLVLSLSTLFHNFLSQCALFTIISAREDRASLRSILPYLFYDFLLLLWLFTFLLSVGRVAVIADASSYVMRARASERVSPFPRYTHKYVTSARCHEYYTTHNVSMHNARLHCCVRCFVGCVRKCIGT